MRTIDAAEAEALWTELVAAVEQGEIVEITRNGTPIARMVAVTADQSERRRTVNAVIEEMRQARARRTRVSRDEILAARDEGRGR